jgi:hypothetical protein
MEHNYLRSRYIVYAFAHMHTDRRLANGQYVLWQSHLVSYAIRPFDAHPFVCPGLLFTAIGRSY